MEHGRWFTIAMYVWAISTFGTVVVMAAILASRMLGYAPVGCE